MVGPTHGGNQWQRSGCWLITASCERDSTPGCYNQLAAITRCTSLLAHVTVQEGPHVLTIYGHVRSQMVLDSTKNGNLFARCPVGPDTVVTQPNFFHLEADF